jgi:hypothetical protein
MPAQQLTDYAGGGGASAYRQEPKDSKGSKPKPKRATLTILSGNTSSRRKIDPFVDVQRPSNTATLGQTLNQHHLAECIKDILTRQQAHSIIDYGSGDGTALATFKKAARKHITHFLGLELLPSPKQPNVIGNFDCAARKPGDLTKLTPHQTTMLIQTKQRNHKIHYCYYGGILSEKVVRGMLSWMNWLWAQGDIVLLVGPSDSDLQISANPGAKATAKMAEKIIKVHPKPIKIYPVAEAGTDITGQPLKPTMYISVYAKPTNTTSWFVAKSASSAPQ